MRLKPANNKIIIERLDLPIENRDSGLVVSHDISQYTQLAKGVVIEGVGDYKSGTIIYYNFHKAQTVQIKESLYHDVLDIDDIYAYED